MSAARKKKTSFRLFAVLPLSTQMNILAENLSDICIRKLPYVLFSLGAGLLTEAVSFLVFLFSRPVHWRGIGKDPVFILGHWCSGTARLQAVMKADPRFITPSALECLRPFTFRADRFFLRILRKLHLIRPSVWRRQDGTEVSPDSPLEDEFALLAMGAPTPLRKSFFFRKFMHALPQADWNALPEKKIRKYCRAWLRFLCAVQARGPGRQLLLMSPQHSYRVAIIRRLFPNARFILIVRRPEEVYRSFEGLLHTYFARNALSSYAPRTTEAEFLAAYTGMHKKLLAEMEDIPAGRFSVVRYEDFARNTMQEMTRIYQDLEMENGPASLARIDAALAGIPAGMPPEEPVGEFAPTDWDLVSFRIRFGYEFRIQFGTEGRVLPATAAE